MLIPSQARANAPYDQDVTHAFDVATNYLLVGEPEITVNPTNPQNIIVGSTAYLPNCNLGTACDWTTPNSSTCFISTSHDGGATWRNTFMPIYGSFQDPAGQPYNSGGDAITGAAPNGTLYAGCIINTTKLCLCESKDVVITSTDGGDSWSAPVEALGADQIPQMVAMGYHPSTGLAGPCDRPWMVVDQSTGTLYVSGTAHTQSYVAASHDGGKTFSFPIPFDGNPDTAFPGPGGNMDAANGVLAASYSSGTTGVFETSTNDGATWNQHVAPAAGNIAADPAHPGRYSILAINSNAVDVYTTKDSGTTWTGPVATNEPPASSFFKPWLAYSTTGVLGAMWRTSYSNGSFDVWSAVSSDNGATFSVPVDVSSAHSPTMNGQGDDFSWITFDPASNCALIGWGDDRDQVANKGWDTWIAEVSLSAYGLQGGGACPQQALAANTPEFPGAAAAVLAVGAAGAVAALAIARRRRMVDFA